MQDEIEILQHPEFILIYPHHHPQILWTFPLMQFKGTPNTNTDIFTTKHSKHTIELLRINPHIRKNL